MLPKVKIKKYYIALLFAMILVVILIFFGAILRQHYLQISTEKFMFLKKVSVLLAELPYNAKVMIKHRNIEFDAPTKLEKHKNKPKFLRFIKKRGGHY